ncbi:ATP-binding protein [Pseudoramibacter faecis]|uniref:ATP-binding protein n=1 Tax=Pseudoramibacter faecis TaxID=3108534 RepID=UPI002E7613EB|nr:ATP-binding protein [Pseudoramibacter sp. HA2172]
MNLNITTGPKITPVKMGLYAPEGFGKSIFASKTPGALVMDTENGTLRIDCRRVNVSSWDEAMSVITAVLEDPSICQTLVIDTMDRLETYGCDYLCAKYHKNSLEDWSYGKGYVALMELFQSFYKQLDKVIAAGVNIILVAHARVRKFELPDQEGAFDKWELKLNKQTSPLMKEWVDALLFGNFQTYVVTTEDRKKKAQGNKRVLYCNHMPTFDAKNRFGLPDSVEFSFDSVRSLFESKSDMSVAEKSAPVQSETPLDKLYSLMKEANVTDADVQKVVHPKATTTLTLRSKAITRNSSRSGSSSTGHRF